MSDFAKKVRSAAVSLWWTLLAGIAFGLFITSGFLLMMRYRPSFVTAMWGDLSWETIEVTALWMIGAYRLTMWLLFLTAIWLTIWARKLKQLAA